MSENKHLSAAGHSIVSNVCIQVLGRAFTFILGAITLKYLQSSALLGIINVRLALLYSTLQFLSREPLRRACISKASKSNSKSWQSIANTIWLGPLVALILAIPSTYIWHLNRPSLDDLAGTNVQDYYRAVIVICASVLVEMLAEPCFIYAQSKGLTDHNPKVEALFVTIKCVASAAVTIHESVGFIAGQSSQILTKLAGCQLMAALISVTYSYTRICTNQKLSPDRFLPSLTLSSRSKNLGDLLSKIFDIDCLRLSYQFLFQTILKQLLTEAERYAMTFFNLISLADQGVYDVVNNLGSLAARLLFKPVEDSAYTLFSQTVDRTKVLDIRKFYKVQENLMLLVKFMLLIGLLVLTFGYNFVPLIVIYGGEKLNNTVAFSLMKWQLFYTPIIAINGLTECFTFAVMDQKQFKQYYILMVLSSFVFALSVYLTIPVLGSACFILSNSFVMTLRIAFGYRIIKVYFNKHGYEPYFSEVLPSLTTTISLIGVFLIMYINQYFLLDLGQPPLVLLSLIFAGWSASFMLLVIIRHEQDLVCFSSMLFSRFVNTK